MRRKQPSLLPGGPSLVDRSVPGTQRESPEASGREPVLSTPSVLPDPGPHHLRFSNSFWKSPLFQSIIM